MSSVLNMAVLGSDDPKKNKLTPAQKAAEDRFAKIFTARKGLKIASDAHVGDYGAPFVDEAGRQAVAQPQKLPVNTVMDIRQLPDYVNPDNVVRMKDGLSYFQDQATGDWKAIHPDIVRSARLNPNRGLSADMALVSR